jgi:hypothetical protein
MQFLISFNGDSNEENELLSQLYIPTLIPKTGIDLYFPKDITIEPNGPSGVPTIVDLKIIVSLLNTDIYNNTPTSINEEQEFNREIKSLRPYIVIPKLNNVSLISQVILCKFFYEDVDNSNQNPIVIQHGSNIKVKLYNLSNLPINISAGTIGFELITSYEIISTHMKIISKTDFIYSEEFIEELIEHARAEN